MNRKKKPRFENGAMSTLGLPALWITTRVWTSWMVKSYWTTTTILPRQMCELFGIFGYPEAANLTYLGLHALQHRGQESGALPPPTTASWLHREHG